MQRQRRGGGGGQYSRASSPVENGHGVHPLGGQLCPGDSVGVTSTSNNGLICGCIRKTSPVRRAINKFRARRAASGSQTGVLGASLAAFVFFVWCGLQTSALLRGGGGGGGGVVSSQPAAVAGGQEVPPQRELRVAAGGGDARVVAGYGEDDVGPRLAYGIMVYQRVGYSPQMTLDQFARMFNALYDTENT